MWAEIIDATAMTAGLSIAAFIQLNLGATHFLGDNTTTAYAIQL